MLGWNYSIFGTVVEDFWPVGLGHLLVPPRRQQFSSRSRIRDISPDSTLAALIP